MYYVFFRFTIYHSLCVSEIKHDVMRITLYFYSIQFLLCGTYDVIIIIIILYYVKRHRIFYIQYDPQIGLLTYNEKRRQYFQLYLSIKNTVDSCNRKIIFSFKAIKKLFEKYVQCVKMIVFEWLFSVLHKYAL